MMFTSPTTQPQRLTYPSVFKAYAQLGLAHEGAQLHGRVIKLGLENDQFIQNTILYMYVNCGFLGEAQRIFDGATGFDVVTWNTMIIGLAKCGEIDKSRSLFDKMLLRNTVSWNSMISGYVRQGRFFEAMELFSRMQEEGIKPSEFTMVSLLNACACLGALRQGEWIHDYIVKNNFALNSIVITAIIDMYSKCGSIDKALQVFKSAPKKGLSCWNSLILGLAMSGRGDEAVRLFSTLESSNLKPDHVSFIGVLTACSHAGMVDRAKDYFLLMEYGNIEMAKRAAKRVKELDPNESSSFVLLSNVYAAHNHFEEAIEQRLSLKEKQMEKEPGCSLIEVNGEVHEFVAGGRLHPRSKDIYHALDDLGLALKEMG
ncbi:hypothetical protein D5086_011276 [Populus alba]|uniref:Uncharacterized protein n=1 Tax=Populus alba TaxID=43335 RepID=A0ACC4CD57_POPAL